MGKFDKLDNYTQEKFIKMLRSFPCLWDETSEAFKSTRNREHREQRDLAFEALLPVLQNNDGYRDATIVHVKDLVRSLLSRFETQQKKKKDNPNYEPKNWYYMLADFLLARTERRSSSTSTQIQGDATQFLHVNLQECPDNDDEVDYGCPTNLTQNRPDDGIPSSSLPPSSSNNIVRVPDTSTNNAANSPEPKRRKRGSTSSTGTSSIDEDFANYVKVTLSKMDEDQREKAEGKISAILRDGRNRRL